MAQHRVTLIPGDGIGPEITAAMQRVIKALDVSIEWETVEAGAHLLDTQGTPLPQSTIDSIKRNKVAIKGPVTTPVGTGFRSVNVALRKELDLYVNLRPAFSMEGTGARYEHVDLVIVRENTEDLYAGIEFEEGSEQACELITFCAQKGAGVIRPDSGISLKPISVTGTRRIVTWAFEYALANNRERVCAVHKANIQKYSDGLFLRVAREVAEQYAGRVGFEDRIVDAACMGLVMNPQQFDVLVLPNLYGDIMSDLCAGMVGGLGIAPGANIGKEYAVFEPVHGSAPQHAGKGIANPTALLLSASLMLDHLGERTASERLVAAVRAVIKEGKNVTYDVRRALTGSVEGSVGTNEFTDAVIALL